MEKLTIKEIMKKTGVPKGAKFLGFAVHLEESDEFLLSSSTSDMMDTHTWTKMIELAEIHPEQELAAKKAIQYGKDSCVVMVFEMDKQYLALIYLHQEDLREIYPQHQEKHHAD